MDNVKYLIEKSSITEALNEIEKFCAKMDKLIAKHSKYTYHIKVRENTNKRSNNLWIVELTVDKEERDE